MIYIYPTLIKMNGGKESIVEEEYSHPCYGYECLLLLISNWLDIDVYNDSMLVCKSWNDVFILHCLYFL